MSRVQRWRTQRNQNAPRTETVKLSLRRLKLLKDPKTLKALVQIRNVGKPWLIYGFIVPSITLKSYN